jgi:hypothetical protein
MVLRQFPPDRDYDPVAAIREHWPPILYATCPDPDPAPRDKHAMRTAFDVVYRALGPRLSQLADRQRSDLVLRGVIAFCASVPIPSPLLDYMTRDPETHELEFKVFTALADLARHPDQLEAFLRETHSHPTEPYPARRFDPDLRRGPGPYCREVT